MNARRGITLVEMLAVVGGCACLIAVSLSATIGAKDAADRALCAANLYRLGQAFFLYAADNNDFLPDCGAYSLLGVPVPTQGSYDNYFPSRANAPGTVLWSAHTRDVGNQANLWLLVKQGYAEPELFVCPATADRLSLNGPRDPDVLGFLKVHPEAGWTDPAEKRFLSRVAAGRCSYSYQNQLAHPETDPQIMGCGPPTTNRSFNPSTLAILADRNPDTRTDYVRQPILLPAEQPEANSLNHHGTGQNVLYLSGEVRWHDTPRCGPVRADGLPDNIYWPDAGMPTDPNNIPRSAADSFLVP